MDDVMDERIETVLIDESAIRRRLAELASELADSYQDAGLTIVAVLKGSLVFLADLMRLLPFPVRIELIRAESYRSATVSSGEVQIVEVSDLSAGAAGRDVLLLDDILDTGLTLTRAREHIAACLPRSLRTCVLLDKPSRRTVAFEADLTGFVIDDHFVVGYGLDFDGEFRNLPHIAVLRGE